MNNLVNHVLHEELLRLQFKAQQFIDRNNVILNRDYATPLFIDLSDTLQYNYNASDQLTRKRAYDLFLAWRRVVVRATGNPGLVKISAFRTWLNHCYETLCEM